MTNPMGLKLKLNYLRVDKCMDDPGSVPAQPVQVTLKGNKTMSKLVPINKLVEHDPCIGCIAENDEKNNQRVDCYQLPDCDYAIYVRASPINLMRHIEWRLENDK